MTDRLYKSSFRVAAFLLASALLSCNSSSPTPPIQAQKTLPVAPSVKHNEQSTAELIDSDVPGGKLRIPPPKFERVLQTLENAYASKEGWISTVPISSQSVDWIIKFKGENYVLSGGGILIGIGGQWKRVSNEEIKEIDAKAVDFQAARRNSEITGDEYLVRHPFK